MLPGQNKNQLQFLFEKFLLDALSSFK